MKRMFALVCLFLVLTTIAGAQDSFNVGIRFTNTTFEQLFTTEDTQGLIVTGDVALLKKEGLRLGLAGNYTRKSYGIADDFYGGGPSLSVDLAKGFVTVRAAAYFGATVDYNGRQDFTKVYELSPRLNLGKYLYIEPVGLSWTRQENQVFSPSEKTVFFGGGLRF